MGIKHNAARGSGQIGRARGIPLNVYTWKIQPERGPKKQNISGLRSSPKRPFRGSNPSLHRINFENL